MRFFTRFALLPLALLAPLAQADDTNCFFDTIQRTTPNEAFAMHPNGTVTHLPTGLMWMRCQLGQRWDEKNETCVNIVGGTATLMTWQQALQALPGHQFAGYSDWRLPNAKELLSIVEASCHTPALNRTAFPGVISDAWTATAQMQGDTPGPNAFRVSFFTNGQAWVSAKTVMLAVRPVRAGKGVFAKRGGLNDTGIDWCADGSNNNLACPESGFEGQDGESGRDYLARLDRESPLEAPRLAKIGGGAAGFDFTKLGADGTVLPADAIAWSCVRDNVTGLMWEIKTTDGGLRDKNHTFTWYNPNNTENGGNSGTEGGGACTGSVCDTHAYAAAVNSQGLCGYTDWRLPTVDELLSIVHNGLTTPPRVDSDYFPDADFVAGSTFIFWSSSPRADNPAHAWGVNFSNGNVSPHTKSTLLLVRLVRAGQ